MIEESFIVHSLAEWDTGTLPEGTALLVLHYIASEELRQKVQAIRLALTADQADRLATELRVAADKCRLSH